MTKLTNRINPLLKSYIPGSKIAIIEHFEVWDTFGKFPRSLGSGLSSIEAAKEMCQRYLEENPVCELRIIRSSIVEELLEIKIKHEGQ